MAYIKTNWQDSPSTATPVSAEPLNHIEQGIKDAHDALADTKDSTVTFSQAATDADIDTGDSHATLFGKIKKRFSTIADAITGKLDKTSVVNNQATTEAGYALDARQANPAVPGSLGNQISQLNSELTSRPLTLVTVTTQEQLDNALLSQFLEDTASEMQLYVNAGGLSLSAGRWYFFTNGSNYGTQTGLKYATLSVKPEIIVRVRFNNTLGPWWKPSLSES